MEFAKNLLGGTTYMALKYQIGEAMANAGVPVLVGGSGNEGLALCTTTAAADCVGITQDTAPTLNAAQGSYTDKFGRTISDPAVEVTVCVTPLALYKARLSGSSTEGTALSAKTVTTASTTGLVATTGFDYSSPSVDECMIWGYSGANAMDVRKITSVSSTAATVTTAFPQDIAVGDQFLHAPFCCSPAGMENHFLQLTDAFYEVDASVAVDTNNNNFRPVVLIPEDIGGNGLTHSHVLIQIHDHIFAGQLT